VKKPRDIFERLQWAMRSYAYAWQMPASPLLAASLCFFTAATLLTRDPTSQLARLLIVYSAPLWAALYSLTSRRWTPPLGVVAPARGDLTGCMPDLAWNLWLTAMCAMGIRSHDGHGAAAALLTAALVWTARSLGMAKLWGVLLVSWSHGEPGTKSLFQLAILPGINLALMGGLPLLSRARSAREVRRARAALEQDLSAPPPARPLAP